MSGDSGDSGMGDLGGPEPWPPYYPPYFATSPPPTPTPVDPTPEPTPDPAPPEPEVDDPDISLDLGAPLDGLGGILSGLGIPGVGADAGVEGDGSGSGGDGLVHVDPETGSGSEDGDLPVVDVNDEPEDRLLTADANSDSANDLSAGFNQGGGSSISVDDGSGGDDTGLFINLGEEADGGSGAASPIGLPTDILNLGDTSSLGGLDVLDTLLS